MKARRPTGPRVSATERHRQALSAALKLGRDNYPRAQSVQAPVGDAQTWDAATLKQYVQQITSPDEAAAWAEANKLYKGIKDGEARHAKRAPKPANSNDPLIVFIAVWGNFPGILSRPLTRGRKESIDDWLREPTTRAMMSPALRDRTWDIDALEKAIQRARKKPELKRLIRELRRSK